MKTFKTQKKALLSSIPVDLDKVKPELRDQEILRLAIIAEFDAVNLYEQMAFYAKDKRVKQILLDIAMEEKTHIGEFQAILKGFDAEFVVELERGEKEAYDKVDGSKEEKVKEVAAGLRRLARSKAVIAWGTK